MDKVSEEIKEYIENNDVVLFMKGTKNIPMCGFSGKIVYILENLGAEFLDVNVLEDEALREGIKKFSDWPTIPQLYIRGEFIGGCDIVTQLYNEGELQKLLQI
jgi:monothiol glutaredoxin